MWVQGAHSRVQTTALWMWVRQHGARHAFPPAPTKTSVTRGVRPISDRDMDLHSYPNNYFSEKSKLKFLDLQEPESNFSKLTGKFTIIVEGVEVGLLHCFCNDTTGTPGGGAPACQAAEWSLAV